MSCHQVYLNNNNNNEDGRLFGLDVSMSDSDHEVAGSIGTSTILNVD